MYQNPYDPFANYYRYEEFERRHRSLRMTNSSSPQSMSIPGLGNIQIIQVAKPLEPQINKKLLLL